VAIIQAKLRRSFYVNALLGFVPDILVSWAVASYTNGGLGGFILTLLVLQCVYLAIRIKNSLWSWFMFWTRNRSMMSPHMEEVLRQNSFPKPPMFMSSADDYLAGIANDQDAPGELRVKAAIDIGVFQGLSLGQRYQLAFQVHMTMEDAIQRYGRTVHRPVKHEDPVPSGEVSLSMPKQELDAISWLADFGFRVATNNQDIYRRTIDQLPYRRATAYADLLDKFDRKSVPELLAEREEDKAQRFTHHENRQKVLWACYPTDR
jgi:hypothetical protein